MKYIFLLSMLFCSQLVATEYQVLNDTQTQRDIPIHISYPQNTAVCSRKSPCPVALLSSGYGVAYNNYINSGLSVIKTQGDVVRRIVILHNLIMITQLRYQQAVC